MSPAILHAQIIHKKIIVCCDGTWDDGAMNEQQWLHTNVLKLSRALQYQDDRRSPALPQIVFYQSGVGTGNNFYSKYFQGTTGGDLAGKVEEAYSFIAQNYQPGDEIYLFGFSRGAYTVRMVSDFIGRIGVLDKKDMNRFADIFVAYQKRGNTKDPKVKAQCEAQLKNYKAIMDNGRKRALKDGDGFTIQCIGVFDTVGSLGLPVELTFFNKSFIEIFGFNDKALGLHVKRAYHAMAANETRKDFDITKFEQSPEGIKKGQILKQVWFAGAHSDIGGGFMRHDLSDLTLMWMLSNIEDILFIDWNYAFNLPRPVADWGKQYPHYSQSGMFTMAMKNQRTLPVKTDNITHEYIHCSVREQRIQIPQLLTNLKSNPALLCELSEMEENVRKAWNGFPKASNTNEDSAEANIENRSQSAMVKSLKDMGSTLRLGTMSGSRYQDSWVGSVIHDIFGGNDQKSRL